MKRSLPLLLLTTGCVEASEFLPKVAFDRLDVKEVSFTDISTDFVFLVHNPNPVKVGVARFDYEFGLEGIDLFSGDNANGFKLQPEGTSELALPIDLVFEETWKTVQATKGEDRVDFQVAGKFGFDTPIGPVDIPYEEEGGFPALRTPKFRFDALRVTQVALAGATLEIDLGVENEHGSQLFFDNFAYGIELENRDVASGLVQTFDVDGASEGTVTIPFVMDFAQVGNAVIDALTSGGPVQVGLGASVDVDTPFGVIPLSVDERGNVQVTPP